MGVQLCCNFIAILGGCQQKILRKCREANKLEVKKRIESETLIERLV